MPPSAKRSSGGKFRRILLFAGLALALGGAYGFVRVGTFLAHEDPLQKSDAIFVLAGTELTRPLEGSDLYREGYAPRIVMTRETLEPAFAIIEHRGARMSSKVERARDVLIQLGIPGSAIMLPDRIHDSTAAEAITLRELVQANQWRRVIIVSSKFHLRRAHFAFGRELRGTGVQLLMRGSRYDNARPERWWRQRSDIRDVMQEVPKLVAYVCGLGA